MDISQYIRELLYLQDCVIVPRFGGFVTSYLPAEIQKSRNLIYPPSKSILFNRRLQANDGILIHHIAAKTGMPYREAEEAVARLARQWNQRLDNKGMIFIPGVGKLYVNSKNTLVFLPALGKNYLMDSYGLRPVAFYAAGTEAKHSTGSEQGSFSGRASGRRLRKLSTRTILAAAAIVIAALLLPQFFFQNMLPESLKIKKLNLLSPGTEINSTAPVRNPLREPDANPKKNIPPVSIRLGVDSFSAGSILSSQETIAENLPSASAATQSDEAGNFYILFGQFNYISDAIRYKKRLDSKYARIFEVFRTDSLYAVGLFAGTTRKEAGNVLMTYAPENSDLSLIARN
ncbi:MAG: cell division protein [Chitinophagales bacterium]|nr:MAG: cell division protein [Chitinophagales bacterium]